MALIKNIQTFDSAPVMSGASITSGTIPAASVSGTAVTLSGAQTITGAKTFSTSPLFSDTPVLNYVWTCTDGATGAGAWAADGAGATWSTYPATQDVNINGFLLNGVATPVSSTDAATKGYVDQGFVALTGAQTVAGVKTFSSAPVMSGGSISSGTIPIASVVGTAMDLTTSQTVGGTKTFSTAPIMSGGSITSGTIPAVSTVGTAMTLAGAQTVTSLKTFTGGLSTNAFQFTAGATSGYVLTSDGSGNASWAPTSGGPAYTVQTTDATPTTLASIPITANSVVTLQGEVSAADAAYADATGGTFSATFRRDAGAAAVVGTPFVTVNADSTATFNVTLSGNNMIVQVTGIAATTYNWKADVISVVN